MELILGILCRRLMVDRSNGNYDMCRKWVLVVLIAVHYYMLIVKRVGLRPDLRHLSLFPIQTLVLLRGERCLDHRLSRLLMRELDNRWKFWKVNGIFTLYWVVILHNGSEELRNLLMQVKMLVNRLRRNLWV